jgi:hypothetical protein
VTGDLVATKVAFLTRRENFIEKFSAALGFLSSVIAFLSGLIMTMVALFGTLWFECGCLLFPADVELYDSSCNNNLGSGGTQEWPPKNEWYMTTDISSTTKSTSTNEFLILIRISSAIPIGCQID